MGALAFLPEHDKAIKSFAFKAWRRAQSAGARSLQIEDVQQELYMVWCVARDKYDPEKGVPFLAYLRNGMKVAVNRWLQKQIDHGQAVSMDEEGEDGSERSRHEAFADTQSLNGVETFEREDARDEVVENLTPQVRTFVGLLRAPPTFLLDGVVARRARQNYAREIGVVVPAEADRVTASMVLDFMELNGGERAKLYAELNTVQQERRRREEMDTRFAPGCYGSPHCYKKPHPVCDRCSYASLCGPEALRRKLMLNAHFGIKPKEPKPPKPPKIIAPPVVRKRKPKPKLDLKLQAIANALRAGRNPFSKDKAAMKALWLISEILIRRPQIANFKTFVVSISKTLVGDIKSAAALANKLVAELLRIGAVVKVDDLYVIKGA